MNVLQEAYERLYPESNHSLVFVLKYSKRFRGHGGRILFNVIQKKVVCVVSGRWEGVAKSIQIGFLQILIAKLNKTKKKTWEMELYHHYIHQLSKHAPKQHFEPVLEEAFHAVNAHYFSGMIEKPNLKLRHSKNPLGTYEYSTDTISISSFLLKDQELLRYVLYHEMLHKKHGYKQQGTRMCSHDAAFREDEHKFQNWCYLEKKMRSLY